MKRIHAVLSLVFASLLLVAPVARGASSDLVVSQVYAGGGNAGAVYANDFVELFNRGASAVDLSGWTVQYATAAGTSWSATPLSGSLAPGRHYLVQLASSGTAGTALPAPDATGTTNLANTGGKVALVHDTAELACGAAPGSCSTAADIHDLVGYGSATDYEGSGPAPALDSTTADGREGGGCTDTDANGADFSALPPVPLNSSAAVLPCGGSIASPSQGALIDIDVASTLSITLEKATLSFGSATVGQTPAPVGERVTVASSNAAGYALSIHRSAFAPADLPLGLGASAPAGGVLSAPLGGGALAGIPIAPATDLLIGTTTAPSVAGGDVWATRVGFVSPLPVVPAGHYSATVTYTVIGR
jgi:lamin tail-like protein